MSNISHSTIARCVNQPTNFTVVTESPRTFNESKCQRLGVNKIWIGREGLELLWVSEDVGVSIMEDNTGVEKLREGLIEELRYEAKISQRRSGRCLWEFSEPRASGKQSCLMDNGNTHVSGDAMHQVF